MAVKILILKEKNLKMLNLRSKLLKIIFITFSFIFFGINSAFGMDSAPPIQNDQRYAKVVFLGYFGAGKTVLYNLLTKRPADFNKYDHTLQINTSILGLEVNGKKVDVYFNDTSAEPRHKDVMDEFCKNSHIVFLLVDAEKLVKDKGKRTSASQVDFEELIARLNKIAPKCRVIVVPTKLENITIDNCPRAFFAKDEVEHYIGLIERTLRATGKDINPIDETYYLTIKSFNDDKAVEHRGKLYNKIAESLINFGLENLPKEPKGFLGKIFEERVYTQKKFLFWEYGEEKEDLSKSKISLVRPDGNNDEKKIYKSGKDIEKKVNIDQKCAIF